MTLIPPDFNQCQAFPNMSDWSFMTLGPNPKPVRCTRMPVWLAVEVIAGKDGQCGSMSLCQACAEIMLDNSDLRKRVQLQPLLPIEGQGHA